MSASGGESEWTAIVYQLANSTECAAASPSQAPDYGPDDGPEIVLHCNRKYGHDGDHEFATQWPRGEKEQKP